MIKVAIIDDEKLMLEGFKHTIDWEQNEYELVALTTSGKSFLEACEKDCPDIVILDIQMPGITGIDLARILKSKYPDIIIIILTSHDKFEFAREAIQLKIDEFILKTEVEFHQILDILEKYRKQIMYRKEEKRDKTFETYLMQLYSAYQSGCNKQAVQSFCDKLAETDPDFFKKGFFAIKSYGLEDFRYANVFEQMKVQKKYSINPSYNCSLYLCTSEFEQADMRCIQCSGLGSKSNDTLLGISTICHNSINLFQSFSEAEMAYDLHFYIDDPILFFEKNDDIQVTCKDDIQSMVSKIRHNIESSDLSASVVKINELLLFFKNKRLHKSLISKYMLEITFKAIEQIIQLGGNIQEITSQPLFNPYDEIIGIQSFDKMLQWVNDRLYKLLDYLRSDQQGEYDNFIKEIMNYINQNYTSDSISLIYVAEYFHISYVYLSRLFSEKTGVHFSDYLANLRIEKAKLLLRKRHLKSYEVAEMVGYSNPSYFAKVFKKAVGISPTVFQEAIFDTSHKQSEE